MKKKKQRNFKIMILLESEIEDNKMEQYILKNPKTFNMKDIFECGQCFRWNEQEDGSYTGIWKENVVNIKKEGSDYIFTGICKSGNLEEEIKEYFDLNRDYEKIKEELSKIDENMKNSIKYGKGIRILNQDLWETIISFIISANNNIPRIKGIIERLSKAYGKKLEFNGEEYYTFPTPEQLRDVTVEKYRKLGLGFRDIRLYETTKMIIDGKVNLKQLEQNTNTIEVKEKLLTLSGVGPKVADCILLFSTLKRLEVFPIDVWVRRVMNDLYIQNEDETKVNKKQIENLAKEKFGDLAGLAQQYLFYWRREA